MFVFRVEEEVVEVSEKKKKIKIFIVILEELQRYLYKIYWEDNWMVWVKDDFLWLVFDEIMKKQVEVDFNGFFKWMVYVFVGLGKGYKFEVLNWNGMILFDLENNKFDYLQVFFFIIFVKFLVEWIDEFIVGVGVVVINRDKDIVVVGWNGFLMKVLYGEYVRVFCYDISVKDKKYLYFIYVE